jgi:pyruvate dehydrogenase E2 component (dihydrolipoamide acetyltransferase)
VGSLRPVPASPATRSLAKRLGVDLHTIDGSGPGGRIEPGDVQAVAEVEDTAATEETSGPAQKIETADADRWGPVERVPLRGIRRATAQNMEKSWREIPHVTHQDVADVTDLEEYRKAHADAVGASGGKLTITVFLVKAVVAALRKHPRFNASLDGDDVVIKDYFNIGVAVDTADGLVVPVIRDADRKSAVDIARELASISAKMRRGDREIDDFAGGTFTITNPGGIGGTSFTPIVNYPEVAILGAAQARWQPVVTGEGGPTAGVTPRLQLPLVLSFDHRVNDGADAARFVRTLVTSLEDVTGLLLGL